RRNTDVRRGRRASMEPSRERDGDMSSSAPPKLRHWLQWSRRANATETCRGLTGAPRLARQASMEPSRERDGDTFDPEESPATEALASMEPSRERDGDRASCPSSGAPLARFN